MPDFINFLDDYDYEPPIYDLDRLNERYPDLVVTSYGGACPVQAEGNIFGYPFYFRFRHGYATLSLAVGKFSSQVTEYKEGIPFGDSLLGVLSESEFVALFTFLADELKVKLNGHKQ